MSRINMSAVAAEGYNHLIALEGYLHKSLDAKLISLVKLRASQLNGCLFCLHMHFEEALKAGDSAVRVNALSGWRESRMFTARERAALKWTEALTFIATDRAEDDTYEAVRAEFSEKELADLTLAIAAINAWNRIAISTRLVHPADKAA